MTFPLAAALAPLARAGAPACAGTLRTRAQAIRNGTTTWSGAVNLASLADSPTDPGFRVGGIAAGDQPRVVLAEGELCSLFATIGDTGLGQASVEIAGGRWTNTGRLQVGDVGPGRLRIGFASVEAAETRVGRLAGGEILVDDLNSFDAGALLVGSDELPVNGTGSATVEVVNNGGLRTGPALIGAAHGTCVGTSSACAEDADCPGSSCTWTQRVRIADGGLWLADTVHVGGGTIVDDAGIERRVFGNGVLVVEDAGNAATGLLAIGTDTRALPPGGSSDFLSHGTVVVRGVGGGGNRSGLGADDLTVGDGGVGRLLIEDGALVETTAEPGCTVVGFGGTGLIRVVGVDAATGLESTLKTQTLFIEDSGTVRVDDGRLEASTGIQVDGQLEGAAGPTIVTPSLLVEAGGKLSLNAVQSPRPGPRLARRGRRRRSAGSHDRGRPRGRARRHAADPGVGPGPVPATPRDRRRRARRRARARLHRRLPARTGRGLRAARGRRCADRRLPADARARRRARLRLRRRARERRTQLHGTQRRRSV